MSSSAMSVSDIQLAQYALQLTDERLRVQKELAIARDQRMAAMTAFSIGSAAFVSQAAHSQASELLFFSAGVFVISATLTAFCLTSQRFFGMAYRADTIYNVYDKADTWADAIYSLAIKNQQLSEKNDHQARTVSVISLLGIIFFAIGASSVLWKVMTAAMGMGA